MEYSKNRRIHSFPKHPSSISFFGKVAIRFRKHLARITRQYDPQVKSELAKLSGNFYPIFWGGNAQYPEHITQIVPNHVCSWGL